MPRPRCQVPVPPRPSSGRCQLSRPHYVPPTVFLAWLKPSFPYFPHVLLQTQIVTPPPSLVGLERLGDPYVPMATAVISLWARLTSRVRSLAVVKGTRECKESGGGPRGGDRSIVGCPRRLLAWGRGGFSFLAVCGQRVCSLPEAPFGPSHPTSRWMRMDSPACGRCLEALAPPPRRGPAP